MNGQHADAAVTNGHLNDPESWGWVGELAESALKSTGILSLELLTQGSRWVNRRVETIELIDELRVRQQVSIDFRLPQQLPGSLPMGKGNQYVLPLLLLPRRSDLAYFDVRDESEQALPVLTRQENARLTGLIMITAAERAIATSTNGCGRPLKLSEALRAYLAAIPTRPLRRALAMAGEIISREDFLYPDEAVAQVLLADTTFCDLLGVCQYSSAVHIPLSASPGERRIVKVSWEGRWDNPPGETKGTGYRKRLAHGWRTLQRFAGWRAQIRVLDTPQVGSAESHHIQIAVPPGVELTEASCRNGPPRVMLPGGETEQVPAGESDPYQPFAAAIAPHAHLYIPRAYEARAGLLEVGLRSARHSLLPAAIVTGVLVTALLALYTVRADEIVGQSEPGAAILLLVPAVLAGFLVRPDEHAMARMLLRGPRLMTTALGILPLVAAATLISASGDENDGLLKSFFWSTSEAPGALVLLWGLLAGAAMILTLGLIASMVLPQRNRRADSDKPPPAPAQNADGEESG